MVTGRKYLLRKQLQIYRDRMPLAARNKFSRTIVERIIETTDWPTIGRVHCYIPSAKKHEVDTWPLLEYIWRTWPGIEVAAPGPLLPDGPIAYTIDSRTEWSNDGQVPYPVSPRRYSGNAFDLIIVPCLGFDGDLYRLGYGSGYYDRFLMSQGPVATVGVAFQSAFVPAGLPHEKHDVRLSQIVTELGTLIT